MPSAIKPLVAAVVAVAVSMPAAAAQSDADAEFFGALSGIQAEVSGVLAQKPLAKPMAARTKTDPQAVLESTLVVMNDGPITAGLLVSWLRESGAAIAWRAQTQGRSSSAYVDGKPAVYLDPSVAAETISYRYVAVHVAKEAGALMLRDFLESAEKRYLAASRVAETFFELGGTRMTMGAMDGHEDAAMEETIRLWVEHDPASGVSYLKQKGVATLAEVRAKAASEAARLGELIHIINDQMLVVPNDPNAPSLRAEAEQAGADREKALKTVADADAALKQFEEFKAQEKDWLWANQGMLQ